MIVIGWPSRRMAIVSCSSGRFEMASLRLLENVIVSPFTDTTTSFGSSPAFSAGSPALTARMCGWTSGRTPMSPISNRLPSGVFGVTFTEPSLPSRT